MSNVSTLNSNATYQATKDELNNNIDWAKLFCIIIHTANRSEAVKQNLEALVDFMDDYPIDVVIYDSSDDLLTKDVVDEFHARGYTNIIYDRYTGQYDKLSIDKKVIEAYEKYAPYYEHVLAARDRTIINLPELLPHIKDKLIEGYDCIVINNKNRDLKKIGNKDYTDCREFFREKMHDSTTLSATITKSSTILSAIKEFPLSLEKNYSLYIPIALAQYFACHEFKAAGYFGNVWKFVDLNFLNQPSFWYKHYVWQWADRWYTAISLLPSIYDEDKSQVLKLEVEGFKLFESTLCLRLRAQEQLCFDYVYKNREVFRSISETPLSLLYAYSMIPPKMADLMINKRKRWYVRLYRIFIRVFVIAPLKLVVDKAPKKK